MTVVMVGSGVWDEALWWEASEERGVWGRENGVPVGGRDGVHGGVVVVIRGIAGEM